MDDLTTERSFDSQGKWVVNVLGLFLLTCYPWVFAQPALTDVRSTGAGIKCLYCKWHRLVPLSLEVLGHIQIKSSIPLVR